MFVDGEVGRLVRMGVLFKIASSIKSIFLQPNPKKKPKPYSNPKNLNPMQKPSSIPQPSTLHLQPTTKVFPKPNQPSKPDQPCKTQLNKITQFQNYNVKSNPSRALIRRKNKTLNPRGLRSGQIKFNDEIHKPSLYLSHDGYNRHRYESKRLDPRQQANQSKHLGHSRTRKVQINS